MSQLGWVIYICHPAVDRFYWKLNFYTFLRSKTIHSKDELNFVLAQITDGLIVWVVFLSSCFQRSFALLSHDANMVMLIC